MQYKKLEGIILKKQNYKESDQIITIWTYEAGKIRVNARGVRLAKSKLVYSLQELSLVTVEITGRNFPTIVSVAPIQQFNTLTEDLKKTAVAFYAAELMLKMTADEHPNPQAFLLFRDFLTNLDRLDYSQRYHPILESFSLKILDSLGFSIEHAKASFKIPQDLDADIKTLTNTRFELLEKVNIEQDQTDRLHKLINKFIEYILERNIKSEPFLISI